MESRPETVAPSPQRARKAHFGELVQLDGSFHLWYETRAPRACLMNLVDDATGRTRARLGDQETIWAAVDVLRRWIEAYGVPLALYTDWKNVYVREPNAEEQATGAVPLTQFGRMWDATAANAFLETTNLPEHNTRFAQVPASTDDFHRRTPSRLTLDRVFQLEDTRVLSNDWVIRYDRRYFQVARQSHQAPARSTVLVREAVTGAIEIRYRGRLMRWSEIPVPPPRPLAAPRAAQPATPAAAVSVRPRPNVDHPWRRGYVERQQRGFQLERGR